VADAERTMVVGVELPGRKRGAFTGSASDLEGEDSLAELGSLAESAGAEVVERS
jgi:transcriptional regulator with GAF, ATPase, and Fis domain